MDLPIIIHKEALIPLHRQLTNALLHAITSGRLAPKAALPSTRELAETLSISRRTVVRSYNDLISQGYLETKSGGRTFVSNRPPIEAIVKRSHAEAASQPHPTIDPHLLSDFTRRLLDSGDGITDFGDFAKLNYCAAPADMLPVKQWRQLVTKQCAVDDDNPQLDYVVDVFGDLTLREEMCRYLRRSKALKCSPDQLITFSDTKTSLDLIARTLCNEGDIVVLEDPGYIYARQLFQAHGADVRPIPIDENGLRVDELKKLDKHCRLLYVTPSHQDPTGAVMSLERRKELLAWAKDHCDFIVEDAFDSDYSYSAAPLPALHAMEERGRVLYLYSFWKLLYPLTANGYLVVPPDLIEAFRATKQHVNRFFSTIEQKALAEFISEGHLERYWRSTRSVFKKRRQALIFALKFAFLNQISFFGEGAGLHLTIRFSMPQSVEHILMCAESAGLPMMSTESYYANEAPEREFVVPFCVMPENKISEIVEAFADRLKKSKV